MKLLEAICLGLWHILAKDQLLRTSRKNQKNVFDPDIGLKFLVRFVLISSFFLYNRALSCPAFAPSVSNGLCRTCGPATTGKSVAPSTHAAGCACPGCASAAHPSTCGCSACSASHSATCACSACSSTSLRMSSHGDDCGCSACSASAHGAFCTCSACSASAHPANCACVACAPSAHASGCACAACAGASQ